MYRKLRIYLQFNILTPVLDVGQKNDIKSGKKVFLLRCVHANLVMCIELFGTMCSESA